MKNLLLLTIAFLQCLVMAAQTTPPLTLSFDTQDDFNSWTVINANDGDTWIWQESEPAAACSSASAIANDWLISPTVTLEAGKAYQIIAYVKSSGRWDWQDFSINIGMGNTVEEQTDQLYSETKMVSTFYVDKQGLFSPTSTDNYHIGIHYYSGRVNGTFYVQKVEVKEAPVYPAQIQDLTVTAGSEGALEAHLQWTWPDKNHLDGALEDLTGGKIYRDNALIATVEEATIGGTGTYVDNSMTQAGTYRYKIVAYNTSGDAQGTAKSVTSPWIGEDTPKPVTDLTATADKDKVDLQFTPPTTGTNGGWLNTEALRYKIVRNPGYTTLEEAYYGTLPYRDVVTDLNCYTYTVTPINSQGSIGTSATSNEVVAGNAKDLPYSEPLNTEAGTKLYTIIDGNEDGYTWKFSSYKKMMSYFNGAEADEWLISPQLNLVAGKAYKVSFQTGLESAINESHYKSLEITVGKGNTVDAQSYILSDFYIKSAFMETKEVMFSVPENGEWNIGFHCHGQTSYYSIYLMNIKVEETIFVPNPVSDLNILIGENGTLNATISWTNPSMTTAGTPLTALDKIEVYRGSELIYTDENPVIGETGNFEDSAVPASGKYVYKVIAYSGESSNEATVNTAWIGEDLPLAVDNLNITAEDDQVTLTFDASTGAQNEGWVDFNSLHYRIVRNPGEIIVAEHYDHAEPFVDQVPGLGMYTYTVTPITITGQEGASAVSGQIVAGLAVEPPYREALDSKDAMQLFTIVNANKDSRTWTYSTTKKAADYWGGSSADDYLFTPKLNLKAGYTYSFSFDSWLSRAADSDYKTLEMTIGKDTTAEAQTMFYSETIQSTWTKTITSEFNVPESGIWYIGIHCVGPINGSNDIFVNNLSIEIISEGGEVTGMNHHILSELQLYSKQGTLIIVAPTTQTAHIRTIDGRTLRKVKLIEGNNNINDLPKGIYLINNQKIILH